MLISLIMPIYNAASFLKPCLDSILAQSYRDWELLAVDDGSEDNSLQILEDYAQKDPRIRVFSITHQGIIPALRKGFSHSQGVLISRMDADDRMPPNKLALMYAAWQAHGLGHLITGKVSYFSDQTLGDGYRKYAAWINQMVEKQNHYTQIFRECVIPSCAWLIHRTDFMRCGGFQSERYPEDYDLCLRFYQQQIKLVCIPEIVHFWRDHPNRSSRNDPNYLDNRFLDIKLHYFLTLHAEQLVLWGAGKKGKYIAQYLINQKRVFEWMTNNEKKIGKEVYGKKIVSSDEWKKMAQTNIEQQKRFIIAVANQEEQLFIRKELININLEEGFHFFFFA